MQDLQIDLPQRDIFKLGPYQQNARCLGPRKPVPDGDEIIVRLERDDLGFHSSAIIAYRDSHVA